MACKRCLLSIAKIAQEIKILDYESPPFVCQNQWRKLGVGIWDNPFETIKKNNKMYRGNKPCLLNSLILSHPYYWYDSNGNDSRYQWSNKH